MSLLESIKEEYVRINRTNENSIIDKNKDTVKQIYNNNKQLSRFIVNKLDWNGTGLDDESTYFNSNIKSPTITNRQMWASQQSN